MERTKKRPTRQTTTTPQTTLLSLCKKKHRRRRKTQGKDETLTPAAQNETRRRELWFVTAKRKISGFPTNNHTTYQTRNATRQGRLKLRDRQKGKKKLGWPEAGAPKEGSRRERLSGKKAFLEKATNFGVWGGKVKGAVKENISPSPFWGTGRGHRSRKQSYADREKTQQGPTILTVGKRGIRGGKGVQASRKLLYRRKA